MFSPYKVASWQEKVVSTYISTVDLNAGALVDLDPTDTSASAANASVGYTTLRAGSLKLATVAPQANTAGGVFGRELGIAIPNVNATGPTLTERLLVLANNYMTVARGAAVAVLVPAPGDIIATTEFVGYLGGGDHGTGFIDVTASNTPGAVCGVFNGRFRLVQAADAVRARYIGNTTLNGYLVGLFQFA
jgi:hypothetical protein